MDRWSGVSEWYIDGVANRHGHRRPITGYISSFGINQHPYNILAVGYSWHWSQLEIIIILTTTTTTTTIDSSHRAHIFLQNKSSVSWHTPFTNIIHTLTYTYTRFQLINSLPTFVKRPSKEESLELDFELRQSRNISEDTFYSRFVFT